MATGIGNLPYAMPPVSPFDTITAQETNERIANIEAVADGTGIGDGALGTNAYADLSVTGDKIDDDTVTADKIDFTTFGGRSITVSNATVSTNTSVAVATFDTSVLPPGKYMVVATVQFQPSSSTFSGNAGIAVVYGSQIKDAYVSAASGLPSFVIASLSCEITVTGSGSLILNVIRDTGTNSLFCAGQRSSLTIARIA